MRETILLVVGVVLMSLAVPSTAVAQQDDRTEELKKLVDEARTAFGDEDFETAIDRLLAAYRIEPNARLLYNTARSYEELDDCRLALVYYRAFTQHEGAEENLERKASKKLERSNQCEDYSSSLSGRLVVDSTPPGATIVVDGNEMGATPTEIAGLPSGQHAIALQLDGYKTATQRVELTPGGNRTLEVELSEQRQETTTSSDLMSDRGSGSDVSAGDEVGTDGDGPAISIPAAALAGAGLVGLGVGAYIDLVAIPNTDDERAQFPADSQEYADLTDKRRGQVTTALVGYIGGGALLAAGATWLILDYTGAFSSETARVQPIAAPRRDGAVGGLRIRF